MADLLDIDDAAFAASRRLDVFAAFLRNREEMITLAGHRSDIAAIREIVLDGLHEDFTLDLLCAIHIGLSESWSEDDWRLYLVRMGAPSLADLEGMKVLWLVEVLHIAHAVQASEVGKGLVLD